MLSNNITTYTLVLESSRNYIELPKIVSDVKFIRIRQLKYTKITSGQEVLLLKMSTGSGIHMNNNLYFSGTAFTNVVKTFYLGPTNSTTLFESSDAEVYTIKLDTPEPISTLSVDFLMDNVLTSDISPSNKVIMTLDFVAEPM